MNWKQELSKNLYLKDTLTHFLEHYGFSGLEQALNQYANMQQEYICKTKSAMTKLTITDIFYLEIREHNITIFTQHGVYHKYGTLNNELKTLSPHGFIKCSQNCIVSLGKIRRISNSRITLINNIHLHMSQHYAPKVLMAFSHYNISTK